MADGSRSPEEEEAARSPRRRERSAALMEPNVRFWISDRQVRPGAGPRDWGRGGGRAAGNRGRGRPELRTRAPRPCAGHVAPCDKIEKRQGVQPVPESQDTKPEMCRWGPVAAAQLLPPPGTLAAVLSPRWEKIEKLRQLLSIDEARGSVEDKKMQEAWKRSLSTVHPDNSKLIPAPFRPAAFLPFTGPMVFFSMMPSKGIKSTILPQFSLYTYTTAFNIINGNTSSQHRPQESLLLGAGVVVASTFIGIIPQLAQMKCSLDNYRVRFLVSRALPVLFLAHVSGVNVLASRSLEPARGIRVMDKEGNVIGYSRRAGEKAVKETAVSRTVLFGTAACVTEVLVYFFKRTQFFLQHPWSLWTVKLSCSILALGLMVPVSFSMFPQVRLIQCSQLEEEIQSSTEETELFYNRGV
ncbi:sideroflexin-4 [Orycteropus afer afer]|uniref:Sideroflexin-4 n=1 Tax=Orycteropus afer afer TaxID=1230840 RepID=A0AC54Z5A9_ORYAF|nr:sideroflexin-4 [Orycteropus afer afer]